MKLLMLLPMKKIFTIFLVVKANVKYAVKLHLM
nr:MAG TPA: hypothetical protein [Caudoviricetes sp.]